MKNFITILLFFLISYIPLQAESILNLTQAKEQTTPNPADLKSNWWDYYNVDNKVLEERKKATEEQFQKIQKELPEETRSKLQPEFEKVLIKLQTLIDLKAHPEQPVVQTAPMIRSYTYENWLNLLPQLLEKEKELKFLQLQRELTNASLKSGSNYLDARFSSYLKGNTEDPNRLEDGLAIMQGRISLAIEKIQIANLDVLIDSKKKQYATYYEEIQKSYTKIDFKSISSKTFQSELTKAQANESKSYSDFFIAYEESTSVSKTKNREIADQKMIAVNVQYEIAKMQIVNLEVQQLFVGLEKKEIQLSRKEIQEKIDRWNDLIHEIEHAIPNWEANSVFVLEQALGNLAGQTNIPLQNIQNSKDIAENTILKIQQLNDSIFINKFLIKIISSIKEKIIFGFFDYFYIWWDSIVAFFKEKAGWFSHTLFKIGEIPITPFGLIKFIAIIIIFYILAKLASRIIHYFGAKQTRIKSTSIYGLSRISYYFIFILGIIIAGTTLGFDLTFLAYIAGALAIWVGFSLQSIFHNIISGIIVLLTRTIRINDLIKLESGEMGVVSDISLRTTILQTPWGDELIIPNSELVSKKFTNHTLSNYIKRVHIPFRISLDENKEFVIKVVKEAAKKVPLTSESREPEVWMTGYGENYLKLELVVWVNSYVIGNLATRDPQYYWALDEALRANNIKIPVPQNQVHLY